MTATQNKRIKSLSTRYLGFYKASVPVLLVALSVLLIYASLWSLIETGNWVSITQAILLDRFLFCCLV